MRPRDFSLQTLYGALDEKRRAAGLSWAGATHQINRFGPSRRAIASSTITGLRTKRVAEGNGVLHMLLWLDRTPESFVAGYPNASDSRFRLPQISEYQILQFDPPALHAALSARREARALTWAAVAREIGGVTSGMLTNLARSSRVGFPGVMQLTAWLDQPAVTFVKIVTLPPWLMRARSVRATVALRFNECIKRRDLEGLAALMTDDHAFIDAADNKTHGKDRCLQAWRRFFESFPDYRNIVESVTTTGDSAIVVGRSECSDERLRGPALWSARVRAGLLSEWRVQDDTPVNRAHLGLAAKPTKS